MDTYDVFATTHHLLRYAVCCLTDMELLISPGHAARKVLSGFLSFSACEYQIYTGESHEEFPLERCYGSRKCASTD